MSLLVGCVLVGFLIFSVRPSTRRPAQWRPVLMGALLATLGFVFVRPQFHPGIQLLEDQNPVYSPMAEMDIFVAWVWVGLLAVWGMNWGYAHLRKRRNSQRSLQLPDSEPVESMVPLGKSFGRPALLMAAVVLIFTAGTALFRSSTRKPRRRP